MLVLFGEHRGPKIEVLPLNKIARLLFEQSMTVCHVHQFCVAMAAFVRDEREVRVALLAVGTHDLGVVVHVRHQILLRSVVHVNVDLHERIVHSGLLHAFVLALLQPRLQQLEAVALLNFLDELLSRCHCPHGEDESPHEVLGAVSVQECTGDLRSLHRVDFLNVEFDILGHVVRVEEVGEVLHHVKTIAYVDQRALVRKACLLEEVADLLRVVEVVLARNTLYFLKVVHFGRGLDVLEVHRRVFCLEQYRTEVVKQTLPRVVGLEHLNELRRSQLLGVLTRDLHDHLQILAHVGAQQMVEHLDASLCGLQPEELDDEFRLDHLGARQDALQVINVLVMFERTLHETRFLAEHSDARLVVVSEHLICHDGIGNLRGGHQVHLEQTCLQSSFFRLVPLEHVEKERGALLQAIVLHEHVRDDSIVNMDALCRSELLGEFKSTRRVDPHDVC
mmetsp:Transcript_44228/g.109911  ORF Transcript_44228/g.109911 Transcript_44228/m.109911 type:complete len:449 (-) Transcript_44228:1468-2814(-)